MAEYAWLHCSRGAEDVGAMMVASEVRGAEIMASLAGMEVLWPASEYKKAPVKAAQIHQLHTVGQDEDQDVDQEGTK